MARTAWKLIAIGAAGLDGRASRERDRAFLAVSTLLFLAGALATVVWSRSMSFGMPMRGGWTMSMAWMRMPGQTWLGAFAMFMGMWVVMMVPMMLPSLVPMLSTYRRALRGTGEIRLGGPTALAGAGYFLAWALFGAAAYPVGVTLAAAEMRWSGLAEAVPLATGAVVLFAGCVQLTPWKLRQLVCCRESPSCGTSLSPRARSAWRHGLDLGRHCCLCCSGFMMILLSSGVMDLGVMAAVAAAITVERLAPRPDRVARAMGAVVVAAGALEITRALGAA